MFALADCNNFFVSCERLFRPDLNGRPVIVLSNNDGCAVARSNEAKSLGIKMGDPLFKIAALCKRENVSVFSSNYPLYADISRRVRLTLKEFAEEIEVYSIDEAFINLEGMDRQNFDSLSREISRRCMKNVGIPVSVGISHTKTLAKIASKLCKQYPRLEGGCYMHRSEDVEKVLRKFPVNDVWGIGRRSCQKLSDMGINTAWGYHSLDEQTINYLFGITGLRTWRELHGIPCIEIADTLDTKKSIARTRSFAKEITERESLCEQTANFAASVAEKLRSQNSMCTELIVFAAANRFRETDPLSSISAAVQFPEGTDSTRLIVSAVVRAIDEICPSKFAYKKAGVIASRIISSSVHQNSLFPAGDSTREKNLMKAIDRINRIAGENSVHIAAQGDCKPLSMSNYRSPGYTTCWSEIPVVTIH